MLTLRELEWVLSPREAKEKSTAMIAAYFDESADGKAQKMFVVGGFVGRNAAWIQVERRWKKLLKEYGLDYYHAVECEFGHKQFAKFMHGSARTLDEKKTALRSIRFRFLEAALEAEDIVGFALGIDMEDFHAVCNDNPAARKAFGSSPFYYGYHLAMLSATREVAKSLGAVLAFVADRQAQHSELMLSLHPKLREMNPHLAPHIGSLTFDDKRNFIGLQVADSLVYEVRRMFEAEKDNRPEREEYRLLKQSVCLIELCTRECLETHLKKRGIIAA